MSLFTELNKLLAMLSELLVDNLQPDGNISFVIADNKIELYLPFKPGDPLANVIGKLSFDASEFDMKAEDAFQQISSYVTLYKTHAQRKRDVAVMKIEEAALQKALHHVANQYQGTDNSDWSNGANHVLKLFARYTSGLTRDRTLLENDVNRAEENTGG